MEAQQNDDGGSRGGKGSSGKFVSRQSCRRWTPTSEQIRILKHLYYNNGMGFPTTEQIHWITSRLKQYGKIESRNVFFWFQNHRARDRPKRFTTTTNDHNNHSPMKREIINPADWKLGHQSFNHNNNINYAPATNSLARGNEESDAPKIETLPLFPMHAGDINGFANNFKG